MNVADQIVSFGFGSIDLRNKAAPANETAHLFTVWVSFLTTTTKNSTIIFIINDIKPIFIRQRDTNE